MPLAVVLAFDPRSGSFSRSRYTALSVIDSHGGTLDWEHCEAAGKGRRFASCAHVLSATFPSPSVLPSIRRAVARAEGLVVDSVALAN